MDTEMQQSLDHLNDVKKWSCPIACPLTKQKGDKKLLGIVLSIPGHYKVYRVNLFVYLSQCQAATERHITNFHDFVNDTSFHDFADEMKAYLEQLVKVPYNSFEEMVQDGWRVD